MNEGDESTDLTPLACGHVVDIAVRTRVYNYYDCGFGACVHVGVYRAGTGEPTWHDFRSEGAQYWPEGKVTMLDASRICCVPCGEREVARAIARRRA